MSAPQSVPTVAVVHPEGASHGPLVINESDFDPAVHTRWVEKERAKTEKEVDKKTVRADAAEAADIPAAKPKAPSKAHSKRGHAS